MAQDKLGSDEPMKALPLGYIDAITNKKKDEDDLQEGEPSRWARIRLKDETGNTGTFLFTFEELKNALIRSEEQKEDLPPAGWLQKLQDMID